MSITVEFRDFEDMVGFAKQLLGQVKESQAGPADQAAMPAPKPISEAATHPAPVIPTAPVAPAAPTPMPTPTQPVAPTAPIVPTAVKEYTMDDLSRAAIPLMDAGGQQALLNLLAQFGVQGIPQLPKEQYGAFATALRGLGAKI